MEEWKMRGYRVNKVTNKEVNYTLMNEDQNKNIECCPRCKRNAHVKETDEYIHFEHVVVKAYGNGTYLNTWAKDECTILA
jgi:hypothetical protein